MARDARSNTSEYVRREGTGENLLVIIIAGGLLSAIDFVFVGASIFLILLGSEAEDEDGPVIYLKDD